MSTESEELMSTLSAWADAMKREQKPKTIGGYAGAALALEDLDVKINDRFWALMTRIGHALYQVLDMPISEEQRAAGVETVKLLVEDSRRVIRADREVRDSYVGAVIAEQGMAGAPSSWLDLERDALRAVKRLREPEFGRARFASLLAESAALPNGVEKEPK